MNRKISIIVPAYNEEESLPELYKEIIASIQHMASAGKASDYEIWFVNDGSSDGTEAAICSLIERDKKVHLISFRKNFGKSPALEAAFHHISGDIVFTMDADLQDDPAEFSRFLEKIDEGYDLVVGWKYNRLDPLEKRLPSKLFNAVTSHFSGVKLHDFDCGFKCFRREVIDSIDVYGELHRYIPVLVARNGFRITEITVHHRKREFGHSKYGIERYMRGLLDSFTTTFLLRYHDRPMYFFGRIGLMISFVGFLICAFLSAEKLVYSVSIGDRPMLLLGVLLLIIGFQAIAVGLICNLIVDITFKSTYDESHIKTIV